MEGDFRIKAPNDSYWFLLDITIVVQNSFFLIKEKFQGVLISHPSIKVAVIDVEPQGGVG